VIDVGEAAPDRTATPIDPNLATDHAATFCAGRVKPFVDGFSNPASHDL
jgi:hypothetical protein